MKVEIEESKLQTAYANACDGVKDFMESLFGKKVFEAAKPTLDDYKTTARMRMLVRHLVSLFLKTLIICPIIS